MRSRSPERRFPWSNAAAWAVLAFMLAATFLAMRAVGHEQAATERARFDDHVAAMVRVIDRRMLLYQDALRHAAAFHVAADPPPDARSWKRFVDALELPARYPGIQGVGFARREPGGAERYPIAFLEPHDRRNRAALGFDMYAEPTRREAMARARDEGQAALTGRVTLKQEIDPAKQAGFLMYVPVYGQGGHPADLPGRRAAIVGFAYAPFRAGDLFRGVFGATTFAGLGYRVYDGTEPRPEALLVAHEVAPEPAAARYQAHAVLQVAGRSWLLRVWTPADYPLGTTPLPAALVGLGGAALAVLLFALLRTLAGRLDRARALAAQMTAELRAADRTKDEWLSVISHELRTPLNFIMGFASALGDGVFGPVNDRQREALAKVDLGADRMLALVNDLLDVAKMSAGRFEISPAEVDYAALVAETVASLQPLAQAKRVALAAAIAPEVAALRLRADGPRLAQVLTNLVGNAVKFTPEGGRIDVRVRRAGDAVRTEVADTGIGVPPEQRARIFEPFRQADMSATRPAGGTGLGLSISRALVRAHGGTIDVESRPGAGSTFWFEIPASGASVQDDVEVGERA